MHPSPLAPRCHESGAAKVGQVARDFRLAHAQDTDEITNADFLAGDQVEQAESGAIGQSAEEEVGRKRFRFGGHGAIIYGLTDMSNAA